MRYAFSGNASDLSGNGFHGIISGATLSTNRFNQPNSAYFFDGVNDFITPGFIIDPSMQNVITITGWYYPQSISGNINHYTGLQFGKKIYREMGTRITNAAMKRFNSVLANTSGVSKALSDSSYIDNNLYFVVGVFTNAMAAL